MTQHLVYRPGRLSDFAACFDLIPPAIATHLDVLPRLLELWEELLADACLNFMVVDRVDATGSTVCGFGMSCFINDEFLDALRANERPHAVVELARQWMARIPVTLTAAEIRAANTSGDLNLLVLMIGWGSGDDNDDLTKAIKAKLLESFVFKHGGYHLKSVTQEVFSDHELQRALAIGAQLINGYEEYFAEHAVDDGNRPYLIGSSRDDIKEGSQLSPLFSFSPPRFRFTTGEQEQIEMALLDRTDKEIAEDLHISYWTVLKRWQSIYSQVSTVAPELIRQDVGADTRVGLEKRRRVFGYIRHHLEELRPYGEGGHRG